MVVANYIKIIYKEITSMDNICIIQPNLQIYLFI